MEHSQDRAHSGPQNKPQQIQRIQITQAVLSGQNRIMLEINNAKIWKIPKFSKTKH